MKKVLIILFVFIIGHTNISNAQSTSVPDTLAYLQTIVSNKTQYIGHSFSTLQNALQIQIKCFAGHNANPYDMSKETSTSFGFYFPQNADDFYLSFPRLEVVWQIPQNANQTWQIWKNNNGGFWNTAASNFYANAIIAEIRIFE